MRGRVRHFKGMDSEGNEIEPFVCLEHEFEITEVKIDQPLQEGLFRFSMKDGVDVADLRYDPPIKYKHKASRTEKEWADIEETARERRAEADAFRRKMDALIGRKAPRFPANAKWLNSEALNWELLRGQIVLLDFGADWCAPCRDHLPVLANLHKHREHRGITVIGVHTAGGKQESIERTMRLYDARYPICIDVPTNSGGGWGELFAAYSVDRIPYAVLVGPDTTIVTHGELGKVLAEASSLNEQEGDKHPADD